MARKRLGDIVANLGKVLKTAGKIAIVAGPPLVAVGSELKKGTKPKDAVKKAIKSMAQY